MAVTCLWSAASLQYIRRMGHNWISWVGLVGLVACSGSDPLERSPRDGGDRDAGAGGSTDGGERDAGDACVPRTCAGAGATCGTILDGCGGVVECGACPW